MIQLDKLTSDAKLYHCLIGEKQTEEKTSKQEKLLHLPERLLIYTEKEVFVNLVSDCMV